VPDAAVCSIPRRDLVTLRDSSELEESSCSVGNLFVMDRDRPNTVICQQNVGVIRIEF